MALRTITQRFTAALACAGLGACSTFGPSTTEYDSGWIHVAEETATDGSSLGPGFVGLGAGDEVGNMLYAHYLLARSKPGEEPSNVAIQGEPEPVDPAE